VARPKTFTNPARPIAADRAACALVNHSDGARTIAAVRESTISRVLEKPEHIDRQVTTWLRAADDLAAPRG
jgi:hypothetical protein